LIDLKNDNETHPLPQNNEYETRPLPLVQSMQQHKVMQQQRHVIKAEFMYAPIKKEPYIPTKRAKNCACNERWGAGVETQKNVRGEIGGWGRVPLNETYAPSLSTIYDGA